LIRIDLSGETNGVFSYSIPSLGVGGKSRQPLLDACRQIKRIVGPTAEAAGLFRDGRAEPDIWCAVNWGAEHTISEPDRGKIHIAKYREFTPIREAAE
jgi:hypothetical protein